MTGTAAADPAADGAGAQAPATVVPPGMRSGRWNSSDRAQLEDAVSVARLFGASCVRVIRPGYATIEVDLKHEKAAGDRESVKAAERSYIERTAPKEKELTDEQLAAKAAARKAKKTRQRERRAKEAERAASEAERAERPRAQLRANIEYVMEGLRSAAVRARSQAGSKTRVTYSLPPERDDGYRRGPSVMCATVPQGTVATTVAQDWLANELAEYGVLLEELLQLLGPHASRCSRGRGGGRLARLGLLGRLRRRLRFPFAARGVLRAPPLFEEADQRGFFLPSRSRDAALVAHLLQATLH